MTAKITLFSRSLIIEFIDSDSSWKKSIFITSEKDLDSLITTFLILSIVSIIFWPDLLETSKIISLYPNPTSSKIYIGNQFAIVRLYDLFGRELLQSNSNELDLSNLPNNIYMIKLEDNNRKVIATGKIIKN